MEEETQNEEFQEDTPVQDEAPEQDTQAEETPEEESPVERNWKEARKKMSDLSRAIKERDRQLEELKNEIKRGREPQPEPDEELTDSDFIQQKHLKKNLSAYEKKMADIENKLLEYKIKEKYHDFDSVVTEEAVEYLNENKPELAMSIRALAHDPYHQAALAYELLKKENVEVYKESKQNKQKIEANKAKPTSVQAVKKGNALAEADKFANGLTPDLKKALFKEMNEAAKRRN